MTVRKATAGKRSLPGALPPIAEERDGTVAAVFDLEGTLVASNVSFGMPDRHTIGAAFLPMAISAGLTSAIMDARSPQIVRAVKAADLLLDRDAWGAAWIAAHRAAQAQAQQAGT